MCLKVLYVIDHMGLGGGQTAVKAIVENIKKNKKIDPYVCTLREQNPDTVFDGKLIILKLSRQVNASKGFFLNFYKALISNGLCVHYQ